MGANTQPRVSLIGFSILFFIFFLGDEMLDWIITVSVEATEGLLNPLILAIWKNYRKGVIVHLQSNKVSENMRIEAKECFKKAAIEAEKVNPPCSI